MRILSTVYPTEYLTYNQWMQYIWGENRKIENLKLSPNEISDRERKKKLTTGNQPPLESYTNC
jgi:hypothetical protein